MLGWRSKKIRKYTRYGFYLVVFGFCLVVLSLSLYFSLTPIKVIHILAREVTLEGIEFIIEHFYDPWSQKRKVAYTGPTIQLRPGAIDNPKALRSFLQEKGLMVENVYFYNYFPQNSLYQFVYAPFDQMRRKLALQEYGLGEIWQKYKNNDFQMSLALMSYVKSLWKHNADKGFDPRHFDAFKMIELGRQGKGFWCQVYAMTYVELASYLGLPARVVALSQDGYFLGHAVVEVWSNIWNKWFVVDPDFNIYYVRNSVPLNAIELHSIWKNHKEKEVSMIKLSPRPKGYDVEMRSKHNLLEYYQYVRIDLRNDYHWNIFPRGHPAISDENTLLWYDEFLKPILSFEKKTSKLQDFYWPLNYVYIQLFPLGESDLRFKVFFSTQTPWFSHFEIKVNGDSFTSRANFWEWSLVRGQNYLRICPVNKAGVVGICSEIFLILEN